MPDTVKYAFYLMLAGAAVQALGIIVSLTQTGTLRRTMREQQIKQHSPLSPSAINTLTDVIIVFIVIVGLAYVGLWLWMAFKNRAGRQWARITGTVFFGVQALLWVVGVVTYAAGASSTSAYSAGTTAVSLVVSAVLLVIGLVAVLLLWNNRSSAYFATVPYGGYGQPGMPYGAPYGSPYGPGQAPPYGPGQAPPYGPGQAPPYGPGQAPPYGPGQAPPFGTPGLPPQQPGPGQPPAPGQGPGDFSPPS